MQKEGNTIIKIKIKIKMSSILSMDEIAVLDRQIEQLFDYKPIPEHEVKVLCDKVGKS